MMRTATRKPSRTAQVGPRWTAILEHDSRLDGNFVYAVKTTGVYCRPSCSARPKPENVVIYDTCGEAERAGFRACKRCHPKQAVFQAHA
jgi:AraC family transcriptional regulator of adaptative response/methylated-DNA-[protein]-cysteine methyltransferase